MSLRVIGIRNSENMAMYFDLTETDWTVVLQRQTTWVCQVC
jgi:hypothetical protein